MIQRLAIVGLGLLGGSIAKAARAHRLAHEIVAVGRDAGRLEPALADGVVDRVTTDLAAGVAGADTIVLAAPVAAIENVLPSVWEAADGEALITDVGSTKRDIVRAAQRLAAGRPRHFVGSHPMTGSEQSGYAAARSDLFRDATVVVTPTDASEPRAVKSVSAFWESLGAGRVVVMEPETHDRAVAAISHLPHLAACALVDALAAADPGAVDLAARGFRDTTRIAAGDPEMWTQIFLANREALAAVTRGFLRSLAELTKAIDAGSADELRRRLAEIKARRERLS